MVVTGRASLAQSPDIPTIGNCRLRSKGVIREQFVGMGLLPAGVARKSNDLAIPPLSGSVDLATFLATFAGPAKQRFRLASLNGRAGG
jgi:hypothetical protein